MRTTLTLDPDVEAKVKKATALLRKPFKTTINEALRIGLNQLLRPPAAKAYRTLPHAMGLKEGYCYDNIGDLLAQAEGEDYKL